MKLFLKKLFAKIILISSQASDFGFAGKIDSPSWGEKINYFVDSAVKLTPIAYVLSLTSWWFGENKQFGEFMCILLIMNMGVGLVYHLKSGTFEFKEFIWKNIGMAAIVVCGYTVLDMLRYTAGDNIAGEMFRVLIQIITLLYPGSKILKNLYVLSNGHFPPEFIMKKLYNFEKNGDLNEFFNKKKEDDKN